MLRKINLRKVIAILIMLGAIFLLVREIIDFINLPSVSEVPETISLFKNKEDTHGFLYLWSIIFFAGLGLYKKNWLFWVFTQSFVLIFLIFYISILVFDNLSFKSDLIQIFITIFFSLFFMSVLIFFNVKKVKDYFLIHKKYLIYYILFILIVGFTFTYFFIYFYQ